MTAINRRYNKKFRSQLSRLAFYAGRLEKVYDFNEEMVLRNLKNLVFRWREREKDEIIKQAVENLQFQVNGINSALEELGFTETLELDFSSYEIGLRKKYLNK
jgi:hypothetical protein